MWRQRQNLQSKGMEDSPAKDLNEMEASNLLDRIQKNGYKDVQGTQWQLQGAELELQQHEKGNINCKQEPGKIKNTISEIKNTLEGITSRLDEAEYWILNQLAGRQSRKKYQVEQLHEKRLKKYEDSLRELQDNMKCNNIRIIGIPEGQEKEQGIENLFEKMTEHFPNLERGKAT